MLPTTLARAATCASLAAVTATGLPAPAASAVDAATAAKAAELAYAAYSAYRSHQFTLQDATKRIVGAIDAAKRDILDHLDELATSDARACARSAVVNAADLPVMSPDTRQAFANGTVDCLALIEDRLAVVRQASEVDDLGFALNALGPVALVAKARAGMSVAPTRGLLVEANERVVARIGASCTTVRLRADATPGRYVEVQLRCTASTGHVGTTLLLPGQRVDYGPARRLALRQTSQPVAVQALAVLRADAARRSTPGRSPAM